MKKILYIVGTCSFFLMCKSPQVEYIEYERKLSQGATDNVLNSLDAKDDMYSVLIFTQGFKGEKVKVENCSSIIYEDVLKSVQGLGYAKQFRLNNDCLTSITDIDKNYSFQIKANKSSKFKYIYIDKNPWKNGRYKITYSNTLRGFM